MSYQEDLDIFYDKINVEYATYVATTSPTLVLMKNLVLEQPDLRQKLRPATSYFKNL